VKRGLTYGIYSYYNFEKEASTFTINSSTRLDKVGELVSVSLDIINQLVAKGVKAEELELAKSVYKGNFPRAVETAEGLAQNLLLLRFQGISDDYLKQFNQNIDKISIEDINRVIKEHMRPNNMQILIYAPYQTIKTQVNNLGEVSVKDYKSYIQ
jgi:zinc protease